MPVSRKGSRPRFSLYLSSQLMVGVARVFEKQVNYFIGQDIPSLLTLKLTVFQLQSLVTLRHIEVIESNIQAENFVGLS